MDESEEGLRRTVTDALRLAPDFDGSGVTVVVDGDTVQLRGHVRSHSERLAAQLAVRNLDDVAVVDNQLEVHVGGPHWGIDDEQLESAVGRALEATGLPVKEIHPAVLQHIVTLTGRVATPELRAKLRQAVAAVDGVDFIDNRIVVDPARSEVERGGLVLDEATCWMLLRAAHFGRLAVRAGEGVDIFPVNHRVGAGALYFRSGPGSKLAELAAFPEVAFEADGAADKSIWSVVVRGTASRLWSDEEIHRSGVDSIVTTDPAEKSNFVRIDPIFITGRRFGVLETGGLSSEEREANLD